MFQVGAEECHRGVYVGRNAQTEAGTSGSDVTLMQTRYGYNGTDNSGRLNEVIGNSGTSGSDTTLGYQAGTEGLVDALATSLLGSGTSGGTLTTHYSYDLSSGLLTGETVMNGTLSVYSEALVYGAPDGSHSQQIGEREVSYLDTRGSAQSYDVFYTYDSLNQLTSAKTWMYGDSRLIREEDYGFDAVGNPVTSAGNRLTAVTYTTNSLNQITAIGSGWDGGGYHNSGHQPVWDGDGNMTSDGMGEVFSYDGMNRLTQVLMADGTLVEYAYDQDGRMVDRREMDPDGTYGDTKYAYDGSDLIAEFDGATGMMTKSYTWIPGAGTDGSDLLSAITTYDGSGEVSGICRPFYNDHDDVMGLMDQNGAVVATYQYSAFGVRRASGPAADVCNFGWGNYYTDPTTGISRPPGQVRDDYLASLGQFMSRDPSGEDGGVNLYRVDNNDPINENDPTGEAGVPTTQPAAGPGSFAASFGEVYGHPSWAPAATQPAGMTPTERLLELNAKKVRMSPMGQVPYMLNVINAVNNGNTAAADALMNQRFTARSSIEPTVTPPPMILSLIPGVNTAYNAAQVSAEINAGHPEHAKLPMMQMGVSAVGDFAGIEGIAVGVAGAGAVRVMPEGHIGSTPVGEAAESATGAKTWQEYEQVIRSRYGAAAFKSRQFTAIVDGTLVDAVADNVVSVSGNDMAVEAKFVDDWGTSLRNPASPIGQQPFAVAEQSRMLQQAKAYSQAFNKVIYHSNNKELIAYYSNVFASQGIKNIEFVYTP